MFDRFLKTTGAVIKGATQAVKNANPHNRAIEDLAQRGPIFDKVSLQNTLVHSNGAYIHKVSNEDVKNAKSMFGHLLGKPRQSVVGYLVPEASGGVAVQVNGVTVDHLTPDSATAVRKVISSPTAVKVSAWIIPAKRPEHQKPDLSLSRDSTFP